LQHYCSDVRTSAIK